MLNEVLAQAGAHKRRKRVGRGEVQRSRPAIGPGVTRAVRHEPEAARARCTRAGRCRFSGVCRSAVFNNFEFRCEYQVVNLGSLESAFAAGETADVEKPAAEAADRRGRAASEDTGQGHLVEEAYGRGARVQRQRQGKPSRRAGGTAKPIVRVDPAEAARAKRNSAKKAKAGPGEPAATS